MAAKHIKHLAGPFLDQSAGRPYVEYQPPFLTFWFSRAPVFWLHQLITLLLGLLLIVLRLTQMDRTRRRETTKHTKHTKTKMFCFSCHSCLSWFAALFYGLTWLVKPLTLLTASFMLPQLGWPGC